jgi:hypothetical protein
LKENIQVLGSLSYNNPYSYFLYPKWQGRLYNKRNKVFGGRHGIA